MLTLATRSPSCSAEYGGRGELPVNLGGTCGLPPAAAGCALIALCSSTDALVSSSLPTLSLRDTGSGNCRSTCTFRVSTRTLYRLIASYAARLERTRRL